MGLEESIMTHNYHYNIIQMIFTVLKIFSTLPLNLYYPSPPPETADLFIVSKVLYFPDCYIVVIMEHVTFSD